MAETWEALTNVQWEQWRRLQLIVLGWGVTYTLGELNSYAAVMYSKSNIFDLCPPFSGILCSLMRRDYFFM